MAPKITKRQSTVEYHEGPEARKKFEEGMTKLFKAPKSSAGEPKLKTKRTQGKASKG